MSEQTSTINPTDDTTESGRKVADGTRAVITAVIDSLTRGRPASELAGIVAFATVAQARSQAQTLDAVAEAITTGADMPTQPKPNPATRFFTSLAGALAGGASKDMVISFLQLTTMADDAELSATLDVAGSMLRKITPVAKPPAPAKTDKSDAPAKVAA